MQAFAPLVGLLDGIPSERVHEAYLVLALVLDPLLDPQLLGLEQSGFRANLISHQVLSVPLPVVL